MKSLESVFGVEFLYAKMEHLENRLILGLPIKKDDEDWLVSLYDKLSYN